MHFSQNKHSNILMHSQKYPLLGSGLMIRELFNLPFWKGTRKVSNNQKRHCKNLCTMDHLLFGTSKHCLSANSKEKMIARLVLIKQVGCLKRDYINL